MIKPDQFVQRKFIYLIIFIGLIALAGLNFLGWFFLQGLKSDLTSALKKQFLQVGQASVKLINGNDLENLLPGNENTPTALFYQQLLYELKISNDLENIILLDPSGRMLVDYRLNFRIGDSLMTFPIQRDLLLKASQGQTPAPILLKSGKQYFLSAYFPVLNDFEEPVAILVIDAPLQFFSTLHDFETGTLYIGAGGLFILILFSALILVATRRLFAVEDRMEEQQRLAQLGEMAASVAHEIRNPLSIMKTTAEVLQKRYADTSDEMLTFIPDEIDRLNRLVEDFLQFARQRPLNPEPIQLQEFIQDFVKRIPDQHINTEIQSDLPVIQVDPDALRQILLNLLNNARDASSDDAPVILRVSEEGSKKIRLEVVDQGQGIPDQDREKIFEPFYSTKATGSGLGLAITRQLLRRMGGEIKIRSKSGQGTSVIIWLPRG
jgi:signal transduction histidine kinase